MRSATRRDGREPIGRLFPCVPLGTLSPDPWDLALWARGRIRGEGDVVQTQHRLLSLGRSGARVGLPAAPPAFAGAGPQEPPQGIGPLHREAGLSMRTKSSNR
jgi:hypothetical protein